MLPKKFIWNLIYYRGIYSLCVMSTLNIKFEYSLNLYSQIDTIVHFAADCTSKRCYEYPEEAIENNAIGLLELMESAKDYGKIAKFIHISTDEA